MTGLPGITALEAAARPPVPTRLRRRVSGPGARGGWLVVAVLAVAWSLSSFLAGREQVLNPAGLPLLGRFWAAALHPDLTTSFLLATAQAALTTVAFAVLGTGLSVVAGVVLAVPLSRLWWASGSRTGDRVRGAAGLLVTRGAVGLPRGVHEAVWGLLLVSVLGRDPLVGVLAIAIPFGAMTAKVYAEILDEADQGPYEALRAAGAGRFVALCYGVAPTTLPALTSYAFYRFECSLRSAVILGMIGAGGLGFQLSLSFQGLQYDQLWTCLYALVLLSALAERWGSWLRQADGSPRRWRVSAVLAGLLAVGSVWHLAPETSRWFSDRTLRLLTGLVDDLTPLRLPAGGWSTLAAGAVETLQLSVLAAALATVLGVVVAFVAARGSGTPLRAAAGWLARSLLLVTRAVPPPVWALLVLFVVLPGPLPGALALGIYTFGVLGRLFAEVVENLDPRPRDSLRQLGATPLTAFAYATVPASAGQLASYSLYRWEVAVRETVVVGVVGAGGLGRLLEQQRVAFDYPAMATTVLALVVVSLLVDALSVAVRRSLR